MTTPKPTRRAPDPRYGYCVLTDAMAPAYEQGDLLIVHPGRPIRAGDDVLFSRDVEGERVSQIGRILRVTDKGWRVRRFNPRNSITLMRREWPTAELITGKYCR